jgi:hypothetical protein
VTGAHTLCGAVLGGPASQVVAGDPRLVRVVIATTGHAVNRQRDESDGGDPAVHFCPPAAISRRPCLDGGHRSITTR